MNYNSSINILEKEISINSPTYFIADIAANHDGNIDRAKELIYQAKQAGADCAKFQHFTAEKIVSNKGFLDLKQQAGHQAEWKKPVFDVYKQYECSHDWSMELKKTCDEVGIHFMSTPYDFDAIDMLDKYVPAYKIGSGDITWIDEIEYVASKNKPVLLATGASTIEDVSRAVHAIIKSNRNIVLMQCNTNYTASPENFKSVNLNVLKTYSVAWPSMILGLSDHTSGHATVLGAVALGARVIEKHFTDSNDRPGPDHKFSMTPSTWYEMVQRTRELEYSLGDGIKRVECNEEETIILQRRSVRLVRDMKANEIITEMDIEVLRPAPYNSIAPYDVGKVLGNKLVVDKEKGDAIFFNDIEKL